MVPGGGTDQVGRALAPILSEILGTPIPVINKPGGAGVVGHTAIRQAEPDGYTFGFITPQLLTAPILGTSKLSFTELTPLAMVNSDPGAVTVAANAPWTSLQEFVAHAKANPGKVRVGNSGKGGTWHMVAVELERKADLKLVHVPYNGAAPATRDMLGGHIEAVTVSAAEVRAQVEGGLARMLAVTAPERVEAFPRFRPPSRRVSTSPSAPGAAWRFRPACRHPSSRECRPRSPRPSPIRASSSSWRSRASASATSTDPPSWPS